MSCRIRSASSSRTKLFGNNRNFSNVRLHEGLDQANAYAGMVETHFKVSQFENHVLNSACRSYNKKSRGHPQRAKSAASLYPVKKSENKIEKAFSSTKNPESAEDREGVEFSPFQYSQNILNFTLLKGQLSKKAERVPQYSQDLRQLCVYQKQLRKEIQNLKDGINREKKNKAKISLNCNKIMNSKEQTQRLLKKKQEQNYHLSVQISKTQTECFDLGQQIRKIQSNLRKRMMEVSQENDTVQKLKKFVGESRLILMQEERQVARMKENVKVAYNSMSNSYMQMNQRKEEKAQLLVDIDKQHHKYT